MIKKLAVGWLAVVLWISCVVPVNAQEPPVTVTLDGAAVAMTVEPVIENGTTLVQFRPIFERLGLAIEWNPSDRTVTGSRQGLVVQLQIGNNYALVNGKSVELPLAPKIINNVTMVPLRFVAESTGKQVDWNSTERSIAISSPASEPSEVFIHQNVLQTNMTMSFLFDAIDPTHFIGLASVMEGEKETARPFLYSVDDDQATLFDTDCKSQTISSSTAADPRVLLSSPIKVSPDKKRLLCSNQKDIIITEIATGETTRVKHEELMKLLPADPDFGDISFEADWGYHSDQLIVTQHWVNGHHFGKLSTSVYDLETNKLKTLRLEPERAGRPRTEFLAALDPDRLLFVTDKDMVLYNLRTDAIENLTKTGEGEHVLMDWSGTPGWKRFDTFSNGEKLIVTKVNETNGAMKYLAIDLNSLEAEEAEFDLDGSEVLFAFWDDETYVAGKIEPREYMNAEDQVQLRYVHKGKSYDLPAWNATQRSVNYLSLFKAGDSLLISNTNDNEAVLYSFREITGEN